VGKEIGEMIDASSFHYRVVTTKGPGDATVIAKEAVAAGTDVVVAVGGDAP